MRRYVHGQFSEQFQGVAFVYAISNTDSVKDRGDCVYYGKGDPSWPRRHLHLRGGPQRETDVVGLSNREEAVG